MSQFENRLEPRHRRFLAICLLVIVASLAAGIWLYPRVNTEASIRLDVTQEEARTRAAALAADLGLSLEGRRHAAAFVYDAETKTFLERTLGLEEANRRILGPVRLWRWGHRWFRPLEAEEFRAEIATSGEIASFQRVLPEDAPGGRPPLEEARRVAESFARSTLELDVAELEFLDVLTTERPSRTDHAFVWRDPRVPLGTGDYRHEITVLGGNVGGYRQFVHVPEQFQREHQQLVSRNQSTALLADVFLVLTVLAAVVVFFQRIRLRDIRWRVALAFAGVGAALSFLGQGNRLPRILYDFDTTQSFSGFLLGALFGQLQSALLVGLLIFVLTAAGEALYRQTYRQEIVLGALFTPRGFRTRRFLLSNVLGFTLAAGFFLYQELFYLVAGRFGAWAPAEVPYDDLLGTAIPWAFLLLVGFQPAVLEEFLSRMFSIPFLQRTTRRTWLAVLLPAVIWGFAHANYPNQPFFIRGLELGVVGVVVGVVMLRTGILAPLIWHYLIDALYSSILLFRSGQPYYVLSAVLASGIVLLPVAYAVVSYLRRGAFEDPAPLLARAQSEPAEPDWIPPLDLPPAPLPPWSRRRRVLTLAAGALGVLAASVLPAPRLDRPEAQRLAPQEARQRADAIAARDLGAIDSLHVTMLGAGAGRPLWLRYIAETSGSDAAREAVERYAADFRWKVRYFRPLEAREEIVELDGADGSLVALTRRLDERESRPVLDSESARIRAQGFLVARGVELSTLVLRESSTEKRPARLDHTFVWEAREGDPRNVGEGRHRVSVVVQGDEVGAYRTYFKVPESWERDRLKVTLASASRIVLLTGAMGLLFGIVLWLVFDGHRRGVTRWTTALGVAVPFGVITVLARLNEMPRAWFEYDTATPWNQFLLLGGSLLAVLAALLFALQLAAWGVLGTLFPDLWHLRRSEHRGRDVWNALSAGLAGLAIAMFVARALAWLGWRAPAALLPSVGALESVGWAPWFQIVSQVAIEWLLLTTVAAAAVRLAQLARVQRRIWGVGLIGLLASSSFAEGWAAWAWGLAPAIAGAFALFVFARFVAGPRRLAYGVAIWAGVGYHAVVPWLQAEGLYFQLQGVIALGVLLLPILWLALTVPGRPGEQGSLGTP